MREYLIKHFVFYYNSAYKVHKDAKYGVGWQPQELKLSHAKATQELDDEQNRIYYKINMHGNTISLKLVIYLIKEVNKDISDKEISQQKEDKLLYILKTEIDTATNSITIAGIETSLNIISIAL